MGVRERADGARSRRGPTLAETLDRCRRAARHGFELARANLADTAKDIGDVSTSLARCLEGLASSTVRTDAIARELRAQLGAAQHDLTELQRRSARSIEERRKHLDRFSITVFGRTKVGKSTLMEILTDGDGSRIGPGSQRTTTDVREYPWRGLEVIDVPGIAAVDGREDEELAFRAASRADLVLFLITDDAPSYEEARWLARVRELGKPVLGICNVKLAIDDEEDVTLFLREADRRFDPARLGEIVGQFHAFADRELPGTRIPFAAAHLRARFLARRPQYAHLRDALEAASRFAAVEDGIVAEIIGRGTLLRVKSFLDDAAAPMVEITDRLLEFSAKSSQSGRVLIEKKRQLVDWLRSFRESGYQASDALVTSRMESLRAQIPAFVEEHYDDNQVGARWSELVAAAGIEQQARALQEELCAECRREMSEIARELRVELAMVSDLGAGQHVRATSVFDGKRAWNWGAWLAGSGLGLAGVFFMSGPLGWAAGAVTVLGLLGSFLFDDREDKARRAREKLAARLSTSVYRMERRIRRTLHGWFRTELLDGQIAVLLDDLAAVTNAVFELADAQRRLAWMFEGRQRELARTLLHEALAHAGAECERDVVKDVARVPGLAMMVLVDPDTHFSARLRAALERALGEPLWFVVDTGNVRSLVAQALGRDCDRNWIRIEPKIRVAHVPIAELTDLARARIPLAQQLTGLHVMP